MAKAKTLAELSDELLKIDDEIDALNAKVKALKESREPVAEKLMAAAEKAGNLTAGKGKVSAFSIDEQTTPHAADWDAFYAYMHDNKYYHLLQRRPAVKACQELWEKGHAIPGIEKFRKKVVKVKAV